MKMETPCPYVYKNGKRCPGHIVRVEAYKADLKWSFDKEQGQWNFTWDEPRSHYHLFCSEKDNHAGFGREDALKFYLGQLPEGLRNVIAGK